MQTQFWRILYSFYSHLEKSAELRAIRFTLEKSKGKDLVDFLLKTKEMVAAILSLNWSSFYMDEQFIEPVDLSQVFSAVYDGKAVGKMHLLASIQNRCDSRGICSGEFAVMLLVDFVKTREKEELSSPRKGERLGTQISDSKALARTREQFSVSYGSKDFEDAPDHYATVNTADLMKTGEYGSPNKPMTERTLKAKNGYEFEWTTSNTKTLSDRKAANPTDVRKEQKQAMM